MSDLANRIKNLTPEKRQLLETLLRSESSTSRLQSKEYVAPRTRIEESLALLWKRVLGIGKISINDNFFELGGDSIHCIQIIAKAREIGLQITNNQIFENPTIATLAKVVEENTLSRNEQGAVVGEVLMTPIQKWFFALDLPEPHHWNQAILVEVNKKLNQSLLQKAAQLLLDHHDALRMRFVKTEKGWEQWNADIGEQISFDWYDLSGLNADRLSSEIEKISSGLQVSLDLAKGPIYKIAYFDLGNNRSDRLLMIAHHLVVDGISYMVLIEDLINAYLHLEQGIDVILPEKTTSFKQWASLLNNYATTGQLNMEEPYWLHQTGDESGSIPVDYERGENTEASVQAIVVSLNEDDTRILLHDIPGKHRVQVNEVLITALAQSLCAWTGRKDILIDIEGHGRESIFEGIDLSRTVGWFTSLFPLRLKVDSALSSLETLRDVKEHLRKVPNRGIGYGMLRYIKMSGEMISLPSPQVMFNYLGRFDQVLETDSPFKLASEQVLNLYSPKGKRPHKLQIYGGVVGGQLRINWSYSANLHSTLSMSRLSQDFLQRLCSIIRTCQNEPAVGLAPSDFPDTDLTQDDLAKIFGMKL